MEPIEKMDIREESVTKSEDQQSSNHADPSLSPSPPMLDRRFSGLASQLPTSTSDLLRSQSFSMTAPFRERVAAFDALHDQLSRKFLIGKWARVCSHFFHFMCSDLSPPFHSFALTSSLLPLLPEAVPN